MTSRLVTRLTAPVVAVSLLLLFFGIGGAWYVQRLQKNASLLLASNVNSVLAAERLEAEAREVRFRLDSFLITGEARHLEKIPGLREQTEHWLGEVERTATTDRERELADQVRRGCTHFFAELDRLAQQTPPWKLPAQIHSLINTVLTQEVLRPVDQYREFNEDALRKASEANQRSADRLVFGLLLLGTCGAGAGLAGGYLLALGVKRSIVQINVRLRDTAGRLNEVVGPVTLKEGADLRDLDDALGRVTDSIGQVMHRLQRSEREALRAEQLAMVGRMAAGVAHEVRNPLMAIKILVQTAAERGDGGLKGRDLRVLEEEVVRLEGLTRTFLDFARPPRPEKHPVRLQHALGQTMELLKGRADLQGVRFDVRVPERPVFVEADSGQLHQLLFNLLLNAVEASPPGGDVGVEAQTGPGARGGPGLVTLRVQDSGPGLPAELGEQIFEPFVSTKETGLGLGLSICRGVAEAHGGSVSAANRPGGGAEFTVTLAYLPAAGEEGRDGEPAGNR